MFQTCAHIESDNRNTSGSHTDHDGNDNLEKFHNNTDHGHRNLCILFLSENFVQRSVFPDHIVDCRHCGHQRNLCQEATDSQHQRFAYNFSTQSEIFFGKFFHFRVTKVPNCKRRRDDLPENGSDSRTRHSPAAGKNKHRIQNNVQSRPGKRGYHRKFRASVCPYHRIHRLTEHIKRNSERNPEEIFFGQPECLFVHSASEYRNNRTAER